MKIILLLVKHRKLLWELSKENKKVIPICRAYLFMYLILKHYEFMRHHLHYFHSPQLNFKSSPAWSFMSSTNTHYKSLCFSLILSQQCSAQYTFCVVLISWLYLHLQMEGTWKLLGSGRSQFLQLLIPPCCPTSTFMTNYCCQKLIKNLIPGYCNGFSSHIPLHVWCCFQEKWGLCDGLL